MSLSRRSIRKKIKLSYITAITTGYVWYKPVVTLDTVSENRLTLLIRGKFMKKCKGYDQEKIKDYFKIYFNFIKKNISICL